MIGRFSVVLALLAAPAMAQDTISLTFPVDCTLGEDCFLQQFPDRDPGPGARDFTCGPQSYDGHTGTDIRVADFAAMAGGVPVLAAADGTVRALRNGVADGGTAAAPDGQGCGNGVVLTHPEGWETQYCHLLEDSITVILGEEVTAGTPLGLIGYSGRTEFPHLEFILRRDGVTVDPFDPTGLDTCGSNTTALWSTPFTASGGGILSTGFAPEVPGFDAIQDGEAHNARIGTTEGGLVVWGFFYGGRTGDTVHLIITDPDGIAVIDQEVTLDSTQAQLFRAAGRRMPPGGWAPGLYRGEVTLLRDGAVLDEATTATVLTIDGT